MNYITMKSKTKLEPHICFHPEGHFKNKSSKQDKKVVKTLDKIFDLLESIDVTLFTKSEKNGDLSFKFKIKK